MPPFGADDGRAVVIQPLRTRSNNGTTTVNLAALATAPIASVDGPGTGSARSNVFTSSFWQKYGVRKSSGRHITSAPRSAASSTRDTAMRRLSSASGFGAICTRPTLNRCFVAMRSAYPNRPPVQEAWLV